MTKTQSLTSKLLTALTALILFTIFCLIPTNASAAVRKQARAVRHLSAPKASSTRTAVLASILAGPCANTGLTPTPENLSQINEATLCLINQERARANELPLKVNQHLQQAAESHSQQMISQNYFAHTSPDGESFSERILSSGYISNSRVLYMLGENIAVGTLSLSTPQAMVEAWMASTEHRENILNGEFSETGMGVAPEAPAFFSDDQQGAVYSQTFGVIAR